MGIHVSIVKELQEQANNVISLKGLNRSTSDSIEEFVSYNYEAFKLANTCGAYLHNGVGTLIFPFDSGLGKNKMYHRAWSAGYSALVKTAKLEWPNALVQSINIDCSDKTPKRIAEELFASITSGGAVTELEINANGISNQLVAHVESIENQTKSLNDGDTIVVSGGAKGVTAACLVELTKRRKINIGILGRTELSEEPSYLKGCISDAALKNAVFMQAKNKDQKITPMEVNSIVSKVLGNREVNENIRTLEANGSKVRYMAVDVTNLDDVKKAVSSLRNEFGSIHGIIHAAGVLADKYIHEKTQEQFDRVFKTKINGFINLLAASSSDKLTHICCFSSVAARMGNIGQVDYAMANEILNKVCQAEQEKRQHSCVVKSINWGPWDGGMVSEQLKKHFVSMGVDLIPIDVGATIFADEMEDSSMEHVEIVVGGTFDHWGASEKKGEANKRKIWVHKSNSSFLESHRIESKVVVPMMLVNEWSMRLAKSIFPALFVSAVNHVKVFKGISLDNFETTGNEIQFSYEVKGEKNQPVIDIKIESDKGQPFYSITVLMNDQPSAAMMHKNNLPKLDKWTWNKSDIYNQRLFHGPDFQVIEKLEGISNEACAGLLSKKENKLISSEGSDLFMLDGGIQLAILAMEKWTGNKSSLPLGFESLHLFSTPKKSEHLNCELFLKKKNEMDSEWDLYYKNDEQEVVAEMKGLRMYMYQLN